MDSIGKDERVAEAEEPAEPASPATETQKLRELIRERFAVLAFIPSTNELQRFVLAGAFAGLGEDYDLTLVVPASQAAAMAASLEGRAAPPRLVTIDVPAERFGLWRDLFAAACRHLAWRSRSFALRTNPRLGQIHPILLRLLARPFARRVLNVASRASVWPGLPGAAGRQAKRFRAAVEKFDSLALPDGDDDSYARHVAATLAGIEPLKDLAALIESTQPLYVLLPTSLLDPFCNDVLWACEASDVPCLLLQSGWDNLSSKGVIHHQPAFLGAWGPQSVRHAVDIQRTPKARCTALGAAHYEALRPAAPDWRQSFRASLGVRPGEKLLLFGGAFRQFDETEILWQLDQAIAAGRLGPVRILYRPHPWRADRQSEDDFFARDWRHVVFDPDMMERYRRAKAEPGYLKRHNPIYSMAYLGQVLSAVDAVISPMSTLLLEAMILERPTLAIAFGDGKHTHNPSVTAQMTHFSELARSGAILWCDDSAAFIATCERLLAQVGEPGLAARYQPVLGDIVQSGPGSYSSRLAQFVETMVGPAARRQRQKRAARKRGTISNAYGAHLIMSEYCGLGDLAPPIPGYWMHGWIPAYHNVATPLIALHKKDGQGQHYDYAVQIAEEKTSVPQWVGRRDQADFLAADGYRLARAIGLPFVYLPAATVRREPGTLLVMPPHGQRNHGPGDPLAERYASMIAGIRHEFTEVHVCLNEDDFANGEWVGAFRRHGIHVFVGSDQADRRTHWRMKQIFSGFDYVTTNGFGSHIAYAAYCGAKVSVWGPYAEWPRARMARTHAVKMFPELLGQALELCTESALRRHYPFLFVPPREAEVRVDWARTELGHDARLAPDEARRLFGWNAAPNRHP